MRVLFYIEPHPIRNTKIHFRDVAKEFLPLLSSCSRLDVRLFANSDTLEAIKDALSPYKRYIITPLGADEAVFDSYDLPWTTEGIPVWLDLMEGKGKVSNDYGDVLGRIWQRFPFNVIVHWGENGAITNFIDGRSITRVGMELGCTRPPFLDTLVMDPYGTNGASIVPKLTTSDLRDVVEGSPMSRHEAMLAYSENLENKSYEQQFQALPSELTSRIFKENNIAFLPLQLFDDANLLRFSPYNTLADVVLDVVPKLSAAGYTTIITPHPATKNRIEGNVAGAIARAALQNWSDHIIWLDPDNVRPPNAQLISIADVVITVNSSVGFESLYFDKTVIVLGDAIYKPKDLFPTIDDYLSGNFDKSSYLEGIGYLRRFFLGAYLQSARIRSETSVFERHIALLDRLWKGHKADPVTIAKGIWRVSSPSTQAYAEFSAVSGRSVVGQQEFSAPSLGLSKPTPKVKIFDNHVWLPVARQLILAAEARDEASFSTWLQKHITNEEGLKTVFTVGGIFKNDEYLSLHQDVKDAGVDPLSHFIHYGLDESRAPQKGLPGVSKDKLMEHIYMSARDVLSADSGEKEKYLNKMISIKTPAPSNSIVILDEFPLERSESDRRNCELVKIKDCILQSRNNIAVVAHLYYRDIVPEIMDKLNSIPESFDMIVTLPDWGSRRIEAEVRQAHPEALFYHAANRGRDIGPFVDLLPALIEKNYDAILKVQTKRGYYHSGKMIPELGDLWREEALSGLLGSRGRVEAILEAFRTQASLTMVGPEPHYLGLEDYPYHDGGALAFSAFGPADMRGFFAGTMFWCRPAVLRPLVDQLKLSMTSFSAETGTNDGALAHLIERLFGQAATVSGEVVCAPTDPTASLLHSPEPLKIRMHDRIVQALKDKQAKESRLGRQGALAW